MTSKKPKRSGSREADLVDDLTGDLASEHAGKALEHASGKASEHASGKASEHVSGDDTDDPDYDTDATDDATGDDSEYEQSDYPLQDEAQDSEHAGLHFPVMAAEAIDLLNIQPGKIYVDATAGAGGHLLEIAKAATAKSKIFGFDRDQSAVENLKTIVPENVKLIHSNYSFLKERLSEEGVNTVDGGILADLGVSSMQIDDAARGFSFLRDGPLDMRMDVTQSVTAAYLVNTLPERDLADIIYKFGEERHSKKIARSIVQNRPFETTGKLADVVSRTLNKFQNRGPKRSKRYGGGFQVTKHPATRTFQALRIAVNTELESLEKFLEEAVSLLEPGARLVIISFHSLEDRIVKQFLRSKASPCVCPPRQPLCTCEKKSELLIITRKPVVADEQELLANIRSRSAKLRAGEKVR